MKNSYNDFRLKLQKQGEFNVSVARGKGAVASVSRQASELGIQVLKDGGNAFDAAFALAFALTVYHPQAGNIGGGGYVLFKEKKSKTPRVYNYREVSPSAARKEYFLNESGEVDPDATAFGPRSVCVPGTVKAFFRLHENYGLLKSEDILSHIAGLAREGCKITDYQAQCLNRLSDRLAFSPESRSIYSIKETPYKNGDRLPNPHLAETLLILAKEGEKAFYHGKLGEQIEQDLTEHEGFVSCQDLKDYTVGEVEPIYTEIRGKRVWSVPPEGGGALLLEILNILDRDEFYRTKPFSPDFLHYLAQAYKVSAVDRFFYSGDIDVNSNATYRDLLKKEYADGLFDLISRMGDTKTMEYIRCLHPDEKDLFGERRLPSGNETTHFSIIDSEGNAVSNSYTLNLRYGSKWSVKGAGFLLNGSIDAFSFLVGKPNYFGVMGNPPNLFDANKRPASNMAPVIVTDGSRSEILLGTPGGPTIQTSMAMILFLVLGKKLHPVEAVQASRIHHQAWPDILYKEKSGLSEIIVENLCRKGYDIQDKNEPIGDIHGIFLDGDAYIAVSDYRREGYACAL